MSVINIADVKILKNDCPFNTPFEFEITFECLGRLAEDLEFKVIYVVCPDDEKQDQELECVCVGPVPIGINKFVLEAPPPHANLIAEQDLLGVTAVLLHVSYMNCEFVRIGYLVNNEYLEEELKENPPSPPQIDRIYKCILAKKPRVTRFHINWDDPKATHYPRTLHPDDNREFTNNMAMDEDPSMLIHPQQPTPPNFMFS